MSSVLQVAVIQHDIEWEDADRTLARLGPLVGDAVSGGARLVVLTEMFATGFSARTEAIAEPPGGVAWSFLVDQARRHGIWIVGSLCCLEDPDGLPTNLAMLVGPDGSSWRYAKRHLFSYSGEDERMAAGSAQVVADVDGVRTSLHVCYDLRFAPDFWSLAPGVDLYVVPANWPRARVAHWRSLLVARAIENQAWVIGANRVGTGGGLEYSGDSLVVDPLGEIVADGAGGAEEILRARVDTSAVESVRARYPFLSDRVDRP